MALYTVLALLALVAGSYQAALPNYVVEVYFVVDRAGVERYMAARTGDDAAAKENAAIEAIKKDVDYFVTELNEMYGGMSGLNIQIKKRKLDILSDNILASMYTDVTTALPDFDAWLVKQNAFDTLKYDLAMYWTGLYLYSKGSGNATTGFAHIGGVCDKERASGVVEFEGTYHTVLTTAHELGHNLGTSHDTSGGGYIMAPGVNPHDKNRGAFSPNSIGNIKTTIEALSTNCLLETSDESTATPTTIPPELKDPESLCGRRMNNSNAFMCKNANFYQGGSPKGDIICKVVYCTTKEANGFCTGAFTPDGLVCDANKKCNNGLCVDGPSPDSANVDPDCIWGDQKFGTFADNPAPFEGSCTDFIAKKGKAACYSASVTKTCCGTCGKLKTGPENCEYGDTWEECGNYDKGDVCPSYSNLCCETCKDFVAKRSADDFGETVTIPPPSTINFEDLVELTVHVVQEEPVVVD